MDIQKFWAIHDSGTFNDVEYIEFPLDIDQPINDMDEASLQWLDNIGYSREYILAFDFATKDEAEKWYAQFCDNNNKHHGNHYQQLQ